MSINLIYQDWNTTYTIGNGKGKKNNEQKNIQKPKPTEDEESGMQLKTKKFTTKMIDDLKNARTIKGISQKELAKQLNIPVNIIQDLERNEIPYNMKLYNNIMKKLGVDIHELKKSNQS